MNYLRNTLRFPFSWGVSLFLMLAVQCTWADEDDGWLKLAIPGNTSSQIDESGKMIPLSRWYALSIKEGALILERASKTVPSGTLVLMRIQQSGGSDRQLTPGEFPSSTASVILREGWSASGQVAGTNWNFSVSHKKRPDGRLLAGSLEVIADPDVPNKKRKVLLPPASGMAFAKQELLWLGDMNSDGEPDLLLKRTWVTGEVDFVLVVSPMLATAYIDPDRPDTYFSSGIEPDSDEFKPEPVGFVGKGAFSIREDEWARLLPDRAALEPKVLADRQFKLNGETIRFTLEHLPRLENETPSSAVGFTWGGSVLVRVTFRGKSQVLMQASQPDGGAFSLSVGLVDGIAGVRIDDQPHYNNSFTRYWIFDETEARFRRLRIEHSQGC